MSKRGENIYKRKDNRWEARYIKGYTAAGAVRYGYCYGKTYREAKEKLTQAKTDLLTNKPVTTTQRRRFACCCDEWLTLNRTRIKESTYVKYAAIIEKHIKPKLGDFLVQSLSSVLVEQFGYELLYENELSPKTVRDILMVLHSIIQYTSKHLPGKMQPVDIVYPKAVRKEMRVLSREEQKHFVEFLLSDMDDCKFGVLLALLTGMRIGEICALRWENISFEERYIKVSSTMQRLKDFSETPATKTKILISTPKSHTSSRMIPLTEYAAELCTNRRVNDPAAFILTGESGKYIEPRTLQYRLDGYTRDCGLEGVHFHVLRHTFATRCVEVGFEIKSLSEILGHSNPRITLERYVHSSFELKRDNMNKLEAIGF